MADKGLYLEVAGGVEKKLLTDLENLENRLKSLLEGMKTKPQTKQFDRVQEQIKLLSNMFGALKKHFQSSTGAIEKSAEGVTDSLKSLTHSSTPALQEFGTGLQSVREEFKNAHRSVTKIIPDFEKFVSLIEDFDGGNTRPITAKYNKLEGSIESVKQQFIDLEEASKSTYAYKPKTFETDTKIEEPDMGEAKDFAAKFGRESKVIIDKIREINNALSEVGQKASDQFSISEKEAEKFEKQLKKTAQESVSLFKKYKEIDGKPVEEVKNQFNLLMQLVRESSGAVKGLKNDLSSLENEVPSIGTEEGSVFDEKMRLQDMYSVENPEASLTYLNDVHRQINKTTNALKGQGDVWEELQKTSELVADTIQDAGTEQKEGAEQVIEVLLRWREQLEELREALSKQTNLKETIDSYKETAEQSKKSADVEKRSYEEKQKVIEDAEKQLGKEREERKQASKEVQSQVKKETNTIQESVDKQIKVRKKKKKVLEEEAETAKMAGEQEVSSARKSAEETKRISKEQKEKISESAKTGIDFSQAEEQFKRFTEKVEKGVTDLSDSIKNIFSSFEGLVKEGVRTVEISATPKGFDEMITKQEELDTALYGSAKTAEEVSQREQQAFLESASAFVSASDVIKEHQKEVDNALRQSGGIAEGVSEREKKAFSEIEGTPGKIETPEAESGTLDLMAQLLVQVTKNLDLMSQKLDAAKSDVREFNNDIGGATESTKDFAEEAEKAASESTVEHLDAYNEVYSRMRNYLGDTSEAMSGAKSRAKELANQIVKLGISMKEIGVLETNKDFKEWINSLKVSEIAQADHGDAINRTAKGFRAYTEEGQGVLNITDEMRESLEKNVKTASLFEKRMYELAKASAGGNEEATELGEALRVLGSSIGESDEAFKRFNKITVQLQQHFKDLARRSNETTKEIVNDIDLARVAFQAYEGNIKVTKDSFEILNDQGYKPFLDMSEEVARSLDLIGNKFDKSRKDADKFKGTISDVSAKNEAYSEALTQLIDKYGDSEFHVAAYNKVINKSKQYISEVATALSYEIRQLEQETQARTAAGKSVTKYNKKLDEKKKQLEKVTDNVSLATVAMDKFEDELSGTKKGFRTFDEHVESTGKGLGVLGGAVAMVGKRVKQFAAFAAAAVIVRQAQQGIQQFTEIISGYDQALHNLMAILEITSAKVQILGREIVSVAEKTKFSALEVAQGVQTLGQAGLSLNEAVMALRGVTQLATGTLSDFGDVADLATTALNAFQLAATDSTRIADVFANAINNSKLTIDKLRTSFNYVGAAGKQAGLNLNELTGTLMTLADNGIRASTMGTGLRRMILQMLDPSTDLRVELSKFGEEVEGLNPKMVGWEESLKNLAPLLWDFEKQTVDMEKAVKFFGTRAAQVAAIVIRTTADQSNSIVRATEKTKEYGSAAEMMAKQQEGLALKMKNLEDRIKNVGVAIGAAGLTGIVTDFIDVMREASKATKEWIESHKMAREVIGTASSVIILTSAFMGLGLGITKLKAKLIPFIAKNLKFLGIVGGIVAVVTTLVSVYDRLISKNIKAAKAHSEMAEQIQVNTTLYKTWAKTIDDTFGTDRWENTIKRFKEQTASMVESGAATKDFAKTLEEDLGVALEDITDRSTLEKIKTLVDAFQLEGLNESIQESAGGLYELRKQIALMQAAGHDFGKEMNEDLNKGLEDNLGLLYKINNFFSDMPFSSWATETLAGVFGASVEEIAVQWDELVTQQTQYMLKIRDQSKMEFEEFVTWYKAKMKELAESEKPLSSEQLKDIEKNLAENVFFGFISAIDKLKAKMQESEDVPEGFIEAMKHLKGSMTWALDGTVDLEEELKKLRDEGALTEKGFQLLVEALEKDLSPAFDRFTTKIKQLEYDFSSLGLEGASLAEKFQLQGDILDVKEFERNYAKFLKAMKVGEEKATEIASEEAKKRIAIKRYELEPMDAGGLSRGDAVERRIDDLKRMAEERIAIIEREVAEGVKLEAEGEIEKLKIDKDLLKKKQAIYSKENKYVKDKIGTQNEIYRNYTDELKDLQTELTEHTVDETVARHSKMKAIIERNMEDLDRIEAKKLTTVRSGSEEELEIRVETDQKKVQSVENAMNAIRDYISEESDLWRYLEDLKIQLIRQGIENRNALLEEEMSDRQTIIDRGNEIAVAKAEIAETKLGEFQNKTIDMYQKEQNIADDTYNKMYDFYTEYIDKLEVLEGDHTKAIEKATHERKMLYFDYINDTEERHQQMTDLQRREMGDFNSLMQYGMKRAVDDWQTQSEFIEDTFTSAIGVSKDSISEFLSSVVQGTESVSDAWKNMTDSMLSSITDLMTDYLTQQFLSSMFGMSKTNTGVSFDKGGGWIGQAGSWISSLFASAGHGGGVVGENVGVAVDRLNANLSSLPRYHNGNEYAAVLEKGEGVFTPDQMKTMMGSNNQSPKVTNNIYVQTPDGKLSKESLHQLQNKIGKAMNRSMRRG